MHDIKGVKGTSKEKESPESELSEVYYLVIEILSFLLLSHSSSMSKSIALALSISTGTKSNDTNTAATVPEIKATPNPPNTGSPASKAEPKIIATAVKAIGLALVAAATAIALRFFIPSHSIRDCAKSISKSEFLEEIPINAINPISEVAVRKNVSEVNQFATQCPTITPIRERNEPSNTIPEIAKLL